MKANYHTHTPRCHHASGTEREYVECAIRGGLKLLGFSDHSPQFFPEGYYSDFRMRPEELEDYVDIVNALKKEYANDIEIHLGLEAEYYPAYFEQLIKYISDYGVEYLLLGQHVCGNEIGEMPASAATKDGTVLERYCNQVTEAMQTGLFTYFAHPDIIHFTGDKEIYDTHIRKLCQAAKANQIPLEINLLGIRDRRHYPNENFWKIAGEEGCQVILGADAHTPEDVCRPADILAAKRLIEKYHLHLLDTVSLRRPMGKKQNPY